MSSFQLYDETRYRTHHKWDAIATNSSLWPSKQSQFERDQPIDHLSPSSRTEAIVRGQRELMEMVRNMPESNYELSLKDLVEHHWRDAPQENPEEEEEKKLRVYKKQGSVRKVDRKASVKKNGNIDSGGFYLKVGFPFSFGSKDKKSNNKNKKKNEPSGNSSSKVSPKPPVKGVSEKEPVKGVSEKEWWKKSPSASKDSESSASSIDSGSAKSSGSSSSNSSGGSRRSSSRREKRGGFCWQFIRRPKSQNKK